MSILSFSRSLKNQNGATMVEVMVSLFVLAVGMLGVLAMQVNSVQATKNASLASQANFLAIDIVESMRSAPSSPNSFVIAMGNPKPTGNTCTTKNTDCTPQQLANWSLEQWLNNIESILPGGKGAVAFDGTTVTVTVQYILNYDEETNQATTRDVVLETVF